MNNELNNQNNSNPVQQQPAPQPTVQPQPEVKVEEPNIVIKRDDISDVANTTFDYNALYGTPTETKKEEENNDSEISIFKAHDLELEKRSITDKNINDVTPEFNINALDGSDSKMREQGEVLTTKEQDRADTRRKILFILILSAILIIFVGFIFPAIKGYK